MSRVKDTDKLLLLDDRAVNDNPIVCAFDAFTRKRYLAALAANGVHAVIVKPSR